MKFLILTFALFGSHLPAQAGVTLIITNGIYHKPITGERPFIKADGKIYALTESNFFVDRKMGGAGCLGNFVLKEFNSEYLILSTECQTPLEN